MDPCAAASICGDTHALPQPDVEPHFQPVCEGMPEAALVDHAAGHFGTVRPARFGCFFGTRLGKGSTAVGPPPPRAPPPPPTPPLGSSRPIESHFDSHQ